MYYSVGCVGSVFNLLILPVQIWVAAPKSRLNQLILAGFLLLSQLFRRVYFCDFPLTHTVTYTAKCSERDIECQTGSSAFLPGIFALFAVGLHDLCHKISHCLRCSVLLLSDGVGVGAEGEACVVVSQHTGNRFHIHTVLESQGRECVSQVVGADVFQPNVFSDFLVELHHRVWMVHLSRDR